jgi:hypothetical protein
VWRWHIEVLRTQGVAKCARRGLDIEGKLVAHKIEKEVRKAHRNNKEKGLVFDVD